MKTVLLCLSVGVIVSGQKFASVSVRVEPPGGFGSEIRQAHPRAAIQSNSISSSGVYMWSFLREAFPTYTSFPQIQLPPIYDTTYRYSLNATAPAGFKTGDMPKMMQAMLTDKFSMAVKTTTAPTVTFSLRIHPSVKMNVPKAATKAPPVILLAQRMDIDVPNLDGTMLRLKGEMPLHRPTHYEVTGTMSDLATFLSDHTHIVVRNDTNTSGIYAFKFNVDTPNNTIMVAEGHIADEQANRQWSRLVSNFTFALEPLGLQLVGVKQNLPVVIINHLETMPKQ